MVYEDGNIFISSGILNSKCLRKIEGNRLFQDDKPRLYIDCINSFFKMGRFIYRNDDDVRLLACIQIGAVVVHNGMSICNTPYVERLHVSVAACNKGNTWITGQSLGVTSRLFTL